jgi:hypothetical protein
LRGAKPLSPIYFALPLFKGKGDKGGCGYLIKQKGDSEKK